MQRACNRRVATMLPGVASRPSGARSITPRTRGSVITADTARVGGGRRGGRTGPGDRWGRWVARPARGRRVIAAFSNVDSWTAAQPLRSPRPLSTRLRRCRDSARPGSSTLETEGERVVQPELRTRCQAVTRESRVTSDDARRCAGQRIRRKMSRVAFSCGNARARLGRALRVETLELVRRRGRRSASPPRSRGGRPAPRSGGASPARRGGTSGGPAASCAARAGASPRARSSASRSACGTRATPRTRPARGTDRRARRSSAAERSIASSNASREPGFDDRLGHLVAVVRRERLPLDREHAVALQVAERAVVAEHVEAVAGALERAARACAGGCVRSPTYARTSATRSSAREPAHAVEQLRPRAGACAGSRSRRAPCPRRRDRSRARVTSGGGSGSLVAEDALRRGRRCRRGSRARYGAPRAAALGPVDADEERRDDLAQLLEHQLRRSCAPRAAGGRACAAAAPRSAWPVP